MIAPNSPASDPVAPPALLALEEIEITNDCARLTSAQFELLSEKQPDPAPGLMWKRREIDVWYFLWYDRDSKPNFRIMEFLD